MNTCEENDDFPNIFNLLSNIKEDLKQLKSLGIPTNEERKAELKVDIFKGNCCPKMFFINIQDIVDGTLDNIADLKILLQEASGHHLSLRKLSLIDDHQEGVMDISIRFFGLEWTSVLQRWSLIERKTRSVLLNKTMKLKLQF